MAVRRRVVVHGRVQGVFFRDSLRSRALGDGVAGWVRNLDDGTVEAVLEGSAAAVDSVADWCSRGPAGASVSDVEVLEEAPEGTRGFEVRRAGSVRGGWDAGRPSWKPPRHSDSRASRSSPTG